MAGKVVDCRCVVVDRLQKAIWPLSLVDVVPWSSSMVAQCESSASVVFFRPPSHVESVKSWKLCLNLSPTSAMYLAGSAAMRFLTTAQDISMGRAPGRTTA